MLIIGGKKIIDIVINSSSICKGIVNGDTIYNKSVIVNGATYLNIGDSGEYSLTINKVEYTNISINYNSQYIKQENNKLFFNKVGEYEIELIYKTYKEKKTIYVADYTVTVS